MQSNTTSASGAPVPELDLKSEFPVPAYADWRAAVEAELKGAPFDKKMLTKTYEGITLQPLYRQEDTASLPHLHSFPGFPPFVRGGRASGCLKQSWEISQELASPSPAEFNTAARAGIERGLNALNVVLDRATRQGQDPDSAAKEDVGANGLSIASVADLAKAFEGIDLGKVSLLVRSGASAMPFAALLVALCQQRKQPMSALRGCIEMDPLGVLAHEGRLPQALAGAYREMAQLIRWTAQHAPSLQCVCVHSRAWHEAGGNAVQELAFSLATGVEYLREMAARGLDVNTVAPRVRFALTVGSSLFMEVAKIRAARLLWSSVVASLGGSAEAQRLVVHVRTAQYNKTVLDPYVNILRGTVEAFAGAVGGCDSMQVGAFDEVIRTPDDASQRLARNTQIILQRECDMDKVIDPAGGSWYAEWLTDALAKGAWALFQEVEKKGGMAKALRAGYPQAEVAKVAAEKLKAVAQRRDIIVGNNQYANVKEKPLAARPVDLAAFYQRRAQEVAACRTSGDVKQSTAVLQRLGQVMEAAGSAGFEACVEAALAGATLGEITRSLHAKEQPDAPITPVKLQRAASQIEHLRGAVDRFTAKHGARPKLFLANMGPLAQHKARADFCRGFFSVGGLDVVYSAGAPTPAEAAQKALDSGARAIVICSTDETYPALVPEFVRLVKAKDPTRIVILAGYPQEQVEAHKQAGVDDFVHVRVNAVEFLSNLSAKLGVTL